MGSLEQLAAESLAQRVPYDKPIPMLWKQMAAWRVSNPLESVATLAKTLGLNYQTVWMTTRKYEYQRYENWVMDREFEKLPAEVRRTAEEVKTNFITYSGEMQDRLLAIIETTPDEKLQTQIAQDWLDRGGHQAKSKEMGRTTTIVVTSEVMEKLARRAVEAGIDEGEIVDSLDCVRVGTDRMDLGTDQTSSDSEEADSHG